MVFVWFFESGGPDWLLVLNAHGVIYIFKNK